MDVTYYWINFWNDKKMSKKLSPIIIYNINKSVSGKGNHFIKIKGNQLLGYMYITNSDKRVSGKIYYHSKQTGEKKSCSFNNIVLYYN